MVDDVNASLASRLFKLLSEIMQHYSTADMKLIKQSKMKQKAKQKAKPVDIVFIANTIENCWKTVDTNGLRAFVPAAF